MAKYDWRITIKKGLIMALTVGIPYAVFKFTGIGMVDPAIDGLTVGAIIEMIRNAVKYNNK